MFVFMNYVLVASTVPSYIQLTPNSGLATLLVEDKLQQFLMNSNLLEEVVSFQDKTCPTLLNTSSFAYR